MPEFARIHAASSPAVLQRNVAPVLQRKACCGACDSFEREADQVADQAVRVGEAQLAGGLAAPAGVQRASCQDDSAGVQAKRAGSVESPTQLETSSAMRVARAGGTPLPEAVRRYFEPRFGRDFSQVRVHTDGQAAAAARSVQARAYTLGQHIAFGAGEYAPSTDSGRRLLAHELVHVMQQESAPVRQIRTQSAAPRRAAALEHAPSALPTRTQVHAAPRLMLQRSPIPTNYGTFDTAKYEDVEDDQTHDKNGVFIKLQFDPDPAKVDASKIELVQAVRVQLAGQAAYVQPSQAGRMVPSGASAGYQIDRTTESGLGNPMYAAQAPGPKDTLGSTPLNPRGAQFGFNFDDSAGHHHDVALMQDRAHLPDHGNDAAEVFETAALALEGKQAGTYLGSVSWGWTVDHAGKFTRLPLTAGSKGKPSANFVEAAKMWNKWTTLGTLKTNKKADVYDSKFTVRSSVAKDTEVDVDLKPIIHQGVAYLIATFAAGSAQKTRGLIRTIDISDVGGGNKTIPLPTP
jgi:hypothetical protein